MAEELRLALILLGSLAIGAVVLHGIWTVRKNVNEERKLQAQDAEPEEIVLNDEELEIQSLKIKQMEMDFNTLASSGDSQGLPVVDVDVDGAPETSAAGYLSRDDKDALESIGFDIRRLPKIMVCGPATAAKFAERSIFPDAVAECDFGNAGMLELMKNSLKPNDKLLLLRSDLAKDAKNLKVCFVEKT